MLEKKVFSEDSFGGQTLHHLIIIGLLIYVAYILTKALKPVNSSYDPTDGDWDRPYELSQFSGDRWAGRDTNLQGLNMAQALELTGASGYTGEIFHENAVAAGVNAGLWQHSWNAPYTSTGHYGATVRPDREGTVYGDNVTG